MKKILLLLMFVACIAGQGESANYSPSNSGEQSEYTPLLQDGKTWKYTTVCHYAVVHPEILEHRDLKVEGSYTLMLKGNVEFNGKEYLKLYALLDDMELTDEIPPFAYLRENVDEQKVYALFPFDYTGEDFYWNIAFKFDEIAFLENPEEEVLLYDFKNPASSYAVDRFTPKSYTEVNCNGEIKESPTFEWVFNDYAIVEGIGLLTLNEIFLGDTSDLLGICCDPTASLPCTLAFPHLYSVVDGDGNIIYEDERCKPGCSSNINTGNADSIVTDKVNVKQGVIEVTSAEPTEFALYNAQGVEILSRTVTKGTNTIDVKDVAPGMYIIKLGDVTRKCRIR